VDDDRLRPLSGLADRSYLKTLLFEKMAHFNRELLPVPYPSAPAQTEHPLLGFAPRFRSDIGIKLPIQRFNHSSTHFDRLHRVPSPEFYHHVHEGSQRALQAAIHLWDEYVEQVRILDL
jgi:hypothetical protein